MEKQLRIVQISDFHIGSRKSAYLQKVLNEVHLQPPDLLAITGDLVDENVSHDDMRALTTIQCPVLYCSSIHESYVDKDQAALDGTSSTWERTSKLVSSGSKTRQSGDDALAVLRGAEAAVAIDDAMLAVDEIALSSMQIRAPFDA